ncbi:urea transporter [Porphyromonas asaccharolytica PR426713P-I]|uniref:urea transporter n=1 Tax=Porphyromonas asaccharolytica TaxID=28123 RepID=UPI0001EB2E20|nr:urea transporter [Porphyromonas asaccharolytica]EFR33948.1 urea transporter [Porphyromonas asaccharolytica PR426713P-I]
MTKSSTASPKKGLIQTIYQEIKTLLLGFSQVFLLQSTLSGALILVGLFCNSWQLALLALLGCLVSRSAASLWRDTEQEIADGLYGFNGTLVGIALGVYWEISWLSILLLVVGAALSTWLARACRRHAQLPGLTAPFIIAVWALLLVSMLAPERMGLLDTAAQLEEGAPLWRMLGVALGNSVGQVMFQANVLTGLFFFLAIAWESRRKALYTLLGVFIPMLAIPFVPETVWREGLLGYNAVLCAIYWAGTSERSLRYAVVSVVLSVLIELLALYAGLIPLTAPFVLSVWVVWLWSRRRQLAIAKR